MLDALRKFTGMSRQRACMTTSGMKTVGIGRREDGTGYFSGGVPCGTRFCPNCAPQIQAGRREEIREAVAGAKAQGMTVAFLTLTVQHKAGDPLDELLEMEATCWKALVGTGWWQTAKKRHGARYWVKVIENRHGDAGWHPHIHVLLFLDPSAGSAPNLVDLYVSLIARWIVLVKAYGGHAAASGQYVVEASDADVDRMSGYFSKEMSEHLSWEMTAGDRKSGESRGPAQLLADAAAGDDRSRSLWRELERGTKGRRLIAYANGTRQELRVPSAEPVDALIERGEVDLASDELLVTLPAVSFEDMAQRFGVREDVIALVEEGATPEALLWWLRDRGITAAIAPARQELPFVPVRIDAPPGAPPWLALPDD